MTQIRHEGKQEIYSKCTLDEFQITCSHFNRGNVEFGGGDDRGRERDGQRTFRPANALDPAQIKLFMLNTNGAIVSYSARFRQVVSALGTLPLAFRNFANLSK